MECCGEAQLGIGISETAAGAFVTYHCGGPAGPCELRVTPIGEFHGSRVVWIEGGVERILSQEEVEVSERGE